MFEWNLPSRYDGATDKRGRILETQPYEVRPGPWRVYLRVRRPACSERTKRHWRAGNGRRLQPTKLGRCRYVLRVAREGPRTISLNATAARKATSDGRRTPQRGRFEESRRIVVRDWLIVAIGDSVGSGEGVPEASSFFAAAPWQSRRCHRSSQAGFARAARQIEANDGRSSVTFVHLACSGAAVRTGLLKPYDGAVPPRDEPPLEPQIDVVERLARERPIDALLISAGANDVNFSGIASFCARVRSADCFARPLPRRFGGDGVSTPVEGLEQDFARLRREYRRLARRIAAVVPPGRVYVSEYFDPTHDENGQICEDFLGKIGRAEVQQARDRILRPLNAMLATVARQHGWNLVEGISPAFRQHGYCAGRQAWVSTLEDSLRNLGGFADRHRGTLHPNKAGHEVIGAFVTEALEGGFFPNRDFPLRPFPRPGDDGDDGVAAALVVAMVVGAILLSPALIGLAHWLAPLILLGLLLWLGRWSVTPFVFGFAAAALLLLPAFSEKAKLAAQTFLTLARTARPLILPLLVALAVATSELSRVVQLLVSAVLLLLAWRLIVVPEAKRSDESLGWRGGLLIKLFVHTAGALAIGWALVLIANLVGLTHPYFRAMDDLASGLLLVAIALWAIAILLRLVSFATTPLRGAIALLIGVALYALAGEAGLLPGAVDGDRLRIARDVGLVALAALVVDALLGVARKGEQKGGGKLWSGAAKLGLSAALVSAVVLAVSTGVGLVEASKEERALTPPESQVTEIREGPVAAAGAEADMELARRYAPVLVFAADERWTPISVDEYVEAASLSGPPGTRPDGWTTKKLGLTCPAFGETSCYELTIGCDDEEPDEKEVAAMCKGREREERRLHREGAVYVRVLERGRLEPREPRGVFIKRGPFSAELDALVQYWFFYPYNEWRTPVFAGELVQRHEADWEAVTIGFGAQRQPLFLANSAHCGGSWSPWREVEASTQLPGPRTHPLVAVARGSHANYEDAGEKRSPDWLSCAGGPEGVLTALGYATNIRDETEFGWLWHPPANGWLEATATEPPMSFPGRWGAEDRTILKNFRSRDLHVGEAPLTPSLQGLWRAPVRTIFCGSFKPRDCERD